MTVEKMLQKKAALIIVDMQNDFCHPEGECAKRGSDVSGIDAILAPMQKVIDCAHAKKVPVIFIQTIHTAETDSSAWLERGNGKSTKICREPWGYDFYGVKPVAGDIIVNKHRYSAFIHTRLETVLHTLKAETILVCGVSTNVCVESTARDGYMLDYNLILLDDCSHASFPEAQAMTVKNISSYFGNVVSSEEVVKYL